MHKLFAIPELVEQVILLDVLTNADLFHFGLTCSTLWAVTAPVLWGGATVTMDNLHNLLPESLLLEGTLDTRLTLSHSLTELEWRKLKQYAPHVRTLRLEDVTEFINSSFADDENLSMEFFTLAAVLGSESSPLFNKLRMLSLSCMSGTPSSLAVVNALVGKDVLDLTLSIDHKLYKFIRSPMLDEVSAAEIMQQVVTALRATQELKSFVFAVRDYELCHDLPRSLPDVLSNLTKLERLMISTHFPIQGIDILHGAAVLPRLETIEIKTLRIQPSELRCRHLPSDSFGSLGSLNLTLTFRNSEATLEDILQWFSASRIPHLHFKADLDTVSILGERCDDAGIASPA